MQARKHELVRNAIWDAATDLFADKGFDDTTVDDIAQRAGVSRRSLFRYFSSKSDFLEQGVVSYATEVSAAIKACPAGYSDAEVFRATVLEIARQSAEHPRTRKIMEISAAYPAARAAQLSRMPEVHDRVMQAFARRRGTGSDNGLKANILAGLTLSVLAVIFKAWFEQGEPEISGTVQQVFATLSGLIGEKARGARKKRG